MQVLANKNMNATGTYGIASTSVAPQNTLAVFQHEWRKAFVSSYECARARQGKRLIWRDGCDPLLNDFCIVPCVV